MQLPNLLCRPKLTVSCLVFNVMRVCACVADTWTWICAMTDQPEYQVYFASMSALIFLRLICPAVISPVEWGALSTKSRGMDMPCKQLTHTLPQNNCVESSNHTVDILSVRKEQNSTAEPHHRSLSSDMSVFMHATPVAHSAVASEQERAGAVATVILLAYILQSGELHLWWSGSICSMTYKFQR